MSHLILKKIAEIGFKNNEKKMTLIKTTVNKWLKLHTNIIISQIILTVCHVNNWESNKLIWHQWNRWEKNYHFKIKWFFVK